MSEDLEAMSTNALLQRWDDPDVQGVVMHRLHREEADMLTPKSFRGGFKKLRNLACPVWRSHRDRLQTWTKNFGAGITRGHYLSGPLGCGKSHLAWAAAWELMTAGYKVSAWNVAQFVEKLLNSFHDKYHEPCAGDLIAAAQTADLLLLDDLGAEPTDAKGDAKLWVTHKFYAIANHRGENDKPILITSNLDGEALAKQMPDASGRRFIDRLFTMVEEPRMVFPKNTKSLRRR